MKLESRRLMMEQLDRKLQNLKPIAGVLVPDRGWLHAIRTAIGMSLRQLGDRLGIRAQSVKEIEDREADGSITLRTLRDAAAALDLELVYVLLPKEGSLQAMVEKRAEKIARSIVLRTSTSMALEDQQVSEDRLAHAIRHTSAELLRTMPRFVWD